MKKLAIILALSAVTAISMAAPKTPQMTCAVMTKNKVDIAKATKNHMYADYKGRRYFFCCDGCPQAFKKNPAKFAKSFSIPTPKAPVKKK
jgi:YHS domain-containing protein